MKGRYHHYTPEQKQWLLEKSNSGIQYSDLIADFNSHFQTELAEFQIKGFLWNNKIKTGAYRRKPYRAGDIDGTGKKIKIKAEKKNQQWQLLSDFLGIPELKKAIKAKLKKTDKKLYTRRYACGTKANYVNEKELIVNLLET